MEKVVLTAGRRAVGTKSINTQLRVNGNVPGIYYSRQDVPVPIFVAENALNPLVFTSDTHIIDLKLEGEENKECIIKDVQFDPVTDRIVHFDLLGIIKGEKIQIEVPVLFKGSAEGVRMGGVLQEFLHKVKVECFPSDLPEHIEIDVSGLKFGHSYHVSDIMSDKFTILHPADTVLVSVTHARGEVTTTTATGEEITEPEVIAKGKDKQAEE